MTFWKFIVAGGPVLWVILICSIAALFIFLSKWYEFHRSKVDIRELVTGLVNVLRRDGFIEAITLCDNTPGPVARILASGIKACQNNEDIRNAMDEAAYFEVPRLESRLVILATIAKIAPMLGLLGTVEKIEEDNVSVRAEKRIRLLKLTVAPDTMAAAWEECPMTDDLPAETAREAMRALAE